MYKIIYSHDAEKSLDKLAKSDRKMHSEVMQVIHGLQTDPTPNGSLKIKDEALCASKGVTYRVRCRKLRTLYGVDHQELVVEILRVEYRREVYKHR